MSPPAQLRAFHASRPSSSSKKAQIEGIQHFVSKIIIQQLDIVHFSNVGALLGYKIIFSALEKAMLRRFSVNELISSDNKIVNYSSCILYETQIA